MAKLVWCKPERPPKEGTTCSQIALSFSIRVNQMHTKILTESIGSGGRWTVVAPGKSQEVLEDPLLPRSAAWLTLPSCRCEYEAPRFCRCRDCVRTVPYSSNSSSSSISKLWSNRFQPTSALPVRGASLSTSEYAGLVPGDHRRGGLDETTAS